MTSIRSINVKYNEQAKEGLANVLQRKVRDLEKDLGPLVSIAKDGNYDWYTAVFQKEEEGQTSFSSIA